MGTYKHLYLRDAKRLHIGFWVASIIPKSLIYPGNKDAYQ